jgi:putative DNA primase/helicase
LEADGILAWSLIGLKRLMANNYIFSETDRTNADLQKYKADNSSSLSFVNECCILDAKAEVPRMDLYGAFVEYCKDSGLKELSKTQFNKDLDNLGLVRASALGIRTWRGIKLS